MSSAPRYRMDWAVLAGLAAAMVLARRRGFRADAQRLVRGIELPVRVIGEENIPLRGPGVITINHYWSETFWTPWLGIAVSAVTPVEITWAMTSAWTYPGRRLGRLKRRLSQALLRQVARVYGFLSMPPMPPSKEEAPERALSVRRLMAHTRQNPDGLIGFAPEGSDQPGGVLCLPPSGVGRLGMALARQGLLFYPVGAFEEDGRFCLNFGQAYRLENAPEGDRNVQDRWARRRMMVEIAALLPSRLRGQFDGLLDPLPNLSATINT